MTNPVFPERAQTIDGIGGLYHGATVGGKGYKPGTFTMQRWGTSKTIDYYGEKATFRVELRFDDDCRNGHNSFAMTGEIAVRSAAVSTRSAAKAFMARGVVVECGCLHDSVREHFPELAPLIRWHSFSTDGPMHYLANTVHLAGNLDCWGRHKGQPSRWETFVRFGTSPIRHKLSAKFAKWLQDPDVSFERLEVLRIDHENDRETFGPKFTFGGYLDRWYQCPFDTEGEALDFLSALQGPHEFLREVTERSKGKDRELDAARSAACWPDATDEELSVEPKELRTKLRERLPALIAEFRSDMERCGFAWEPMIEEPAKAKGEG